jgi:hypothetical protein
MTKVKFCSHCNEWLPISEFGISRSLPSGLNRYCRKSVRIKMQIARSRPGFRSYRVKTAPKIRRVAQLLRRLSPTDRVREAIRHGVETQNEIARATKLPVDEICDILAELMLWSREVVSEIRDGKRVYLIREEKQPERKGNVLSSFASVKALMPGRKFA